MILCVAELVMNVFSCCTLCCLQRGVCGIPRCYLTCSWSYSIMVLMIGLVMSVWSIFELFTIDDECKDHIKNDGSPLFWTVCNFLGIMSLIIVNGVLLLALCWYVVFKPELSDF